MQRQPSAAEMSPSQPLSKLGSIKDAGVIESKVSRQQSRQRNQTGQSSNLNVQIAPGKHSLKAAVLAQNA